MKRLLAGAAAAALAMGAVLVATAAPASAHTPQVSATCTELSVNLTQYSDRGHSKNEVTVTIGDESVDTRSFKASFRGTYEIPDPGTATPWKVAVKASDDPDGRKGWSRTLEGTTTPCPTGEEVQVGIYLYPKLDAGKPAAWENSGEQALLTTRTLTLDEDELRSGEHWFTELPEGTLDGVDLCRGWGIQQDLVRGGPDEYTMPESITYPDGSSMDGHLVDWTHQELTEFGVELPSAADCRTTPVDDEVEEPTRVVPAPPAAITACEAGATPVAPENSADVTYLVRTDGVLATPTAGNVFGEDLAGYQLLEDGSALFPIEALRPAAEECDLVPGDIASLCEGDVPYLAYEVALPEGVTVDDENPLTITFLNPGDGEDWTVTGQPLAGRILWPGASADEPQQWPGWLLTDDGTYVETEGNYAWTRDGVDVLFEVNPSYSTRVSYPPATSECANPPAGAVGGVEAGGPTPSGPALASTGATVAGAAAFAALLVGGGALVLWLRRRAHA
ncbi:hypothetical protein JN535_00400 [Cellulosimicrobium cellulans]|uniref:hypothetical protein n=1 Tax=Cellulosimicrobium cellulans TaxID=1710 RepID=UPI0019624870|nr:hypothetical protein [Cellulosimicrobium cellulans]MBN0038633.1 hypothetical protein [Cellulosimicrobium cellulans]